MILVDANRYLYLYKAIEGKRLLPALKAQKDHIFVTAQIVEEVARNKVNRASELLTSQLENLALGQFNIADHLLGLKPAQVTEIRKQWQQLRDAVKKVHAEMVKTSHETLRRISKSQDDVSVALGQIFAKCSPVTVNALERARSRKELGIPPGKPSAPSHLE